MGKRFLNNFSWLFFGQIIRILISFVVSILSVRYLGPNNFGIINYVQSYLAFFTSIVGLGINGVIIYEFLNHKDEEDLILSTAIVLRFIIGLLSTVLFCTLMNHIEKEDYTIRFVAFLLSLQLPFLSLDTINYWFQSQLLAKYSVIVQTLETACVACFKVFLLASKKSIYWFALANTIGVILVGLFYVVVYLKKKKLSLHFSSSVASRMLKGCVPFIFSNLMVVIYGQMDKIMIKQILKSSEQVGLYSAAVAICGMIGFLPVAILDAVRPIIVEAKNRNTKIYEQRVKQSMAGILWTCSVYSLFVTLFSKTIITLLYGEAYISSSHCLQIAVWYTSFSYLGSLKSIWLICEKKNKYVFLFSFLGATSNVILNSLMIPKWGIDGAAVATLITQILTNVLFPFIIKPTRQFAKLFFEVIIFKNIDISSVFKFHNNKD